MRRPTQKLDALTIAHIIRFIREREMGYSTIARKHQNWLKKRLGEQYTPVLMKHGDPDRDGYHEVLGRWFNDEAFTLQCL